MTTMTNPLPHTTEALREAVFTSLGAASVCWKDTDEGRAFQSEEAVAVGEDLLRQIDELTSWTKPRLGLATTRELVRELCARLEGPGDTDLDYRTVTG